MAGLESILNYRLNVVPLNLPPLRKRREDIVAWALDLLRHFNRELKKKFTGLTRRSRASAAVSLAGKHPGIEAWNGADDDPCARRRHRCDLAPEEIREHSRLELSREATEAPSETTAPNGRNLVSLREGEDQYMQQVLVATGNNKTKAARILGIHPTSLLRTLKKDSS